MESNKTNHWRDSSSVTPLSKYENAIKNFYGHIIFITIMIILWFILSYKEIKNNDKNIISTLSLFWVLLSLWYLLLNVSKEWQHYYLFPFMFLPLLLWSFNYMYKFKILYIIIAVIIIHWISQWNNLIKIIYKYQHILETDINIYYLNVENEIRNQLKNKDFSNILSLNKLPIDYKSIWISYNKYYTYSRQFTSEKLLWNPVNIYREIPEIVILDKKSPELDFANNVKYKSRSTYDEIIEARKFIESINNWKVFEKKWKRFKYNIFYEDKNILIYDINYVK